MNLHSLCYSGSGVTEKTVRTLMEALEKESGLAQGVFHSFRKPDERQADYSFGPDDLVIIGSPTYAGKLPNKILPDFQSRLHGNGAAAIALVTFGNRAYDNSLAELCAVLSADGFQVIAAGAFVGRHAFTDTLGEGRPDWDDLRELRAFGKAAAEKLGRKDFSKPAVPGDPDAPYYVPKGLDGQPAKFLKAKPQTDLSKCCNCGVCARRCPMGAIDPADVSRVPGLCIKCQACVRYCTHRAKYFDDPAFLSHLAMLEQNFQEPKLNETFL
ncbi:MAG: 4Fe-4S binding protein [Oscillibacter sp.]|jgi:ferredoxin|nr:4Fe-4S binding protein [Oscillibacter sp.]